MQHARPRKLSLAGLIDLVRERVRLRWNEATGLPEVETDDGTWRELDAHDVTRIRYAIDREARHTIPAPTLVREAVSFVAHETPHMPDLGDTLRRPWEPYTWTEKLREHLFEHRHDVTTLEAMMRAAGAPARKPGQAGRPTDAERQVREVARTLGWEETERRHEHPRRVWTRMTGSPDSHPQHVPQKRSEIRYIEPPSELPDWPDSSPRAANDNASPGYEPSPHLH